MASVRGMLSFVRDVEFAFFTTLQRKYGDHFIDSIEKGRNLESIARRSASL